MITFEEYRQFDAIGLAQLVAHGEVSSRELLDVAIARAEQVNPLINALAHKFYERGYESSVAAAGGRLQGVPFLLKDSEGHLEGTETSIGSRFFAGNIADHDSEVVARYKRAGLVIFGKTTVPELEFSTSTESNRFGITRNPWKLTHSAGGSSGGSAAAVAAGIVPAAAAGDGGGSIRTPAAHCGLFGLKPTRGRTPSGPDRGEYRGGLAVAHVVSRSVRDSALFLDLAAGEDPGAPHAAPARAGAFIEEVMASPRRLRVAMITEPFIPAAVAGVCAAAAREAAALLESMGHFVEEVTFDPHVDDWAKAHERVVCSYLQMILEDRANRLGRAACESDLEPGLYASIMSKTARSSSEYLRSLEAIHAVGRSLARMFERYDIMLTPATAQPPPKLPLHDQLSDPRQREARMLADYCFLSLFNCSGTPAAAVPWTKDAEGLPVSIQLAAPFADEATLLRLAARIEEARPWNALAAVGEPNRNPASFAPPGLRRS